MAAGPGPISKAALTVGRIIHKPFHLPMEFTVQSGKVGAASSMAFGQASVGAAQALASLDPKGPLKWITNYLGTRVPEAVNKSNAIATRNVQVFWGPVSEGAHAIGKAIAGPLAAPYARKIGVPPDQMGAAIDQLLDSKGYPVPAGPSDGGGAPPQAAPNPNNGGGEQGATPSPEAAAAPPQGDSAPSPQAAPAPEEGAPAPQAAAAPAEHSHG